MKLKSVILASLFAASLAACGGGIDDSDASDSSSKPATTASAASIEACKALKYPGSTADPQVYSFDAIAQLDACLYKATGDTAYITDGNNQCKVLAGLLASTQGTFHPLFCTGSQMKL